MSKHWKTLIIILCLWSCKNDIKVAAPWKETIVVYGLLDPAASVNYIRIQKAYLDPDGNAFQFAGTTDSIYPTNLEVKLIVRKNGGTIDTLFPKLINGDDENIKKDSGLFSASPNYLYKITEKIFDSRLIQGGKEEYEYELKVKNPSTGYECYSKTTTTGVLESLAPASNNVNPITVNEKSYLTISYREGRNVKAYDMILRFWYRETRISDTTVQSVKSVDWVLLKNQPTNSLQGYYQRISSVKGSLFYDLLNTTIKPNIDIKREAMYCDIEYYGAGEDLFTYIEVNFPSLGIVQKKPEFSNITNGLGIFSSRYTTFLKKIPVSADMKFMLKTSANTSHLNFK